MEQVEFKAVAFMKDHIGITIDRELLKEIEEARGREKRSTFMEYLLRLGLKAYKDQEKPKSYRLPPEPKEKEQPIFRPNGKPWE